MSLDRRSFLKGLAASALAAAIPSSLCAADAAAPPAKRPNIILIMADDMGFSDLGCYGSEIATPNLDRLAAGGLRFTSFYNAGRCCPTRAALLTGCYSHQVGVGMMVEDRKLPGYRGHITSDAATVAESLREGGYRTLCVGKWHVGNNHPHWPLDRGFDHYYGLVNGGGSYFTLGKRTFAEDDKQIDPTNDKFYATDAFSDAAIKYVDQYANKPEPFFLYLAYTAPHFPLQAWPDDIAKYRGKYKEGWEKLREARFARQKEMGLAEKSWELSPRQAALSQRDKEISWENVQNKDKEDLKMAVYAAMVDRMDQGIGRLLAKLKETGIDQNTLILFCSDNGGCAETPGKDDAPIGSAKTSISYGVGWATASNTPFRRYKRWAHEGGTSSPLIAWWPGRIEAGKITREVGHVIDLAPTCLDVAGVAPLKARNGKDLLPLAGRTLLPALKGGPMQRPEPLFWEHMGNRAIRKGNWKLVAGNNGEWELYDMENDRSELQDLASANPGKVKDLTAEWDAWAKRSNVLPFSKVQASKAKPGEGDAE